MAFHPEELMEQGLFWKEKNVEAATLLLLLQAEGWGGNDILCKKKNLEQL